MRLYLDLCCLQRPFDDQGQARIWLETVTVESVIASIQKGTHAIVSSDILRFENSKNPFPDRSEKVAKILSLAEQVVEWTAEIERASEKWSLVNVGALDALHLASAEAVQADYFATCDDILLSRSKRTTSTLRIVGLLELAEVLKL